MELKHLLIKYKKFLKTDNLSTNTIETYLGDIDVYLNYIGFDSEFTKDDSFERLFSEQNLEDYFESIISSDKYKNREALNVKLKRTLNRKMSSFAKLLSFLVREKKIRTNFVHTFDRSRFMGNIARSDDFKKYVEFNDLKTFVQKLLAFSQESKEKTTLVRDKAIIFLLIFTGVRASVLGNIKLNDLDEQLTRIDNIFLKGGGTISVPIDNIYLKPILSQYIALRGRNQNYKSENSFFLSEKGFSIDRHLVYRVVRKYTQKFLGFTVTPHALRHTFATHMILNGAKTVDVKLMLGHKNITSTQVYQHVNDIKKKYNLINKFYKGENVKA
jgi:site-specific recombinase XerD